MRFLAMRDVAVVTILIAAFLHEATAQFSVDKAMAQISGRDVKQADKWALSQKSSFDAVRRRPVVL